VASRARRYRTPLPVAASIPSAMPAKAVRTTDPRDPRIDRWLRRQPPRIELALRYAVRGRFRNLDDHRAFDSRLNELFEPIAPDEDEYAAILSHAREIGQAMSRQIGPAKPAAGGVE
jgi:hypothetical protein